MDWTNTYLKAAAEHATLASLRILQGDEDGARARLAEAVNHLDRAARERAFAAEQAQASEEEPS